MVNKDVFGFKDYRVFLTEVLESRAKTEKGQRLKLANFLHCNPAYLTRILDGRANLSPEQAQTVNEYFNHTPAESRYFLNLGSVTK